MNTETQISTVCFTKQHFEIKRDFIERIKSFLSQDNEIKTYGIDSNSYYDNETMKIDVGDGIELQINLKITK